MTANEELRLLQDDLLHTVVFFLDAKTIARLMTTCKKSQSVLANRDTLKWIAHVQKMQGLSCLEQLRIAECVSSLETTLEFEWGSVEVATSCFPVLTKFACLLRSHPSIQVKFEGHCGIEAPAHIAVPFSTRRAESVGEYLVSLGIDEDRLSCKGFGKSKALIESAGDNKQDVGGDKNRRVEIYLVHNGVEFPPRPAIETTINCSNTLVQNLHVHPHDLTFSFSFFIQLGPRYWDPQDGMHDMEGMQEVQLIYHLRPFPCTLSYVHNHPFCLNCISFYRTRCSSFPTV
jgi:outer membrane protein OmpA-like peptidoglycan-associated protein